MRIITRTEPTVEMQDWRQVLADSFRDSKTLLEYLKVDPSLALPSDHSALNFPLLVPRPFAEQMEAGNPNDPLLRQILPVDNEGLTQNGYVTDPLAEKHSNIRQGIIHKYHGRVLLLTASACAVNCRYCFRRHFDYADNRLSREERQKALDYVRNDQSISEVILSGGDPLMLQDSALSELISGIESIPHVTKLRIHSRLPVVIPQRLTTALIERLNNSRLGTSLVLHINHAAELTEAHKAPLATLRSGGTWLLNQSVLLKGVNDKLSILTDLSERLFTFGVTPYYLHLPDKVEGTHHFDSGDIVGQDLYRQMREKLPGYLVPQLVREEPGAPFKIPKMSFELGH